MPNQLPASTPTARCSDATASTQSQARGNTNQSEPEQHPERPSAQSRDDVVEHTPAAGVQSGHEATPDYVRFHIARHGTPTDHVTQAMITGANVIVTPRDGFYYESVRQAADMPEEGYGVVFVSHYGVNGQGEVTSRLRRFRTTSVPSGILLWQDIDYSYLDDNAIKRLFPKLGLLG